MLLVVSVARAADGPAEGGSSLDYTIRLETVLTGVHKDFCWFHPRVGAIPRAGRDGGPAVVMTLQKHLMLSDHYSGLFAMRTDDRCRTWTVPDERPELAWRNEPDNVILGVCDCTPGWHAETGKLLVIGLTVRYVDGHQVPDQMRAVAYTVHDPQAGTWSVWRDVAMPDPAKFYSAGCGCSQWLTEPDGTLLVPIYYHGQGSGVDSVTVMRCSFDGLHYDPIRPWTFDDGTDLGSYNTQQHWVTHSDGLFLAYTRRGANNDHMFRHRAPLFIGRVDPDNLCVIRKSERILIPERGASLGNFGVAAIDEHETWVTVGEGMFWPDCVKRGADGAVFAARVIRSKPNRLAARLR